MPNLPAFCQKCGTIFNSGIHCGPNASVTISNCISGPCPSCGGNGKIPDGLYKFTSKVLTLLTTSQTSRDQLQTLLTILQDSQCQKNTPDAIADSIHSQVPELSDVAHLFKSIKNDLWGFLAVIIALITLILSSSSGQTVNYNININNFFNQEIYYQNNRTPPYQDTRKRNKIGRNDPCPCGSGLKFKRCCGK